MSINPLAPEQHPDTTINVVTRRIAPASVNVDKAIEIGTRELEQFERELPQGFKKSIIVGETKVYDTSLIYSRVIGLQASSRNVNIVEVLSCELSPVPTAL